MNIFSPHIPFTALAELAEKPATSGAATEHLSECRHCSRQFDSIKQAIALMRSDTAEDAPMELIKDAKNIFRGRAPTEEPSLLRRVIASLSFDSLTTSPAFGLRSQTSASRQLIYASETVDIDVRVAAENEEWQIAGQLLGASCPQGEVELESDSFSATTQLNELCEFSFGSVPTGAYKISVRLPDVLIETPPLEIGP